MPTEENTDAEKQEILYAKLINKEVERLGIPYRITYNKQLI